MRRVASGPVTKSQGRVELRQYVHDWQRALHARGSLEGATVSGPLPPLKVPSTTEVASSRATGSPDVCNDVVGDIARRKGSGPTWRVSPEQRRVAHAREEMQCRRTPTTTTPPSADSCWHPDVAGDWRARTASGQDPWSSDPACDLRVQRLTLEFDQERCRHVAESSELREQICSLKARQDVLSQLAQRRWEENKEMVEVLTEAEAVSENAESNFGFYQFLTDQKVLNAVRRCQENEQRMEEMLRSELDACSELARATKVALDEAVEVERSHSEAERDLLNVEARLSKELGDSKLKHAKEMGQAATQSAREIAPLKTRNDEMATLVGELCEEVAERDEELRQMQIAETQQRIHFEKSTAELAKASGQASTDAWEQARSENNLADKKLELLGAQHEKVLQEIHIRASAKICEARAAERACADQASIAAATCLHFETCEKSAEVLAAQHAQALENANEEICAAQVALQSSAAVEFALRAELREARQCPIPGVPLKQSQNAAQFMEEIDEARRESEEQAAVTQDVRDELHDALRTASQSSVEASHLKEELADAQNASQKALLFLQSQLDEARTELSSLREEMTRAEVLQIAEQQQYDAGGAALQLLQLVAEVQDLTFSPKTSK